MEILVVSHKYPPSIGGMQKHCYQLVSGLEKKHRVHKLVQGPEGKLRFFFSAAERIKQIIKENPQIEVIYLNDGLMAFILGKIIRMKLRPMVMTAHGLDIVFPLNYFQKWIKSNLNLIDAIVPVSQGTLEECTLRGIENSRLQLVPNAIEVPHIPNKIEKEPLEFDSDKKYLVSIGRSVRRKGRSWFVKNVLSQLDEHIEIILIGPKLSNMGLWRFLKAILPKKLFDLIIIFAGVAIDELELEVAMKNPVVKNRVHRLMGLSNDELMWVLQKSDLFVMPNIKVHGDYEGFGLVLLEAVLAKVPVLASNIEGITTAIKENKNGNLVPAENSQEWISKINSILTSSDKSKIEEYYQYSMENYTIDKMVEGYEKVIKSVV